MTHDAAAFPKPMVIAGWMLAGTMLLYPIEAVPAWLEARRALEAASTPVIAPTGGLQFDLRTAIIHCGPVGWAGSVAAFLGVAWVAIAGGLWLYHRSRGYTLVRSSKTALAAVLAGVVVVFGVQASIWRLSGILVTSTASPQPHEEARCITTS